MTNRTKRHYVRPNALKIKDPEGVRCLFRGGIEPVTKDRATRCRIALGLLNAVGQRFVARNRPLGVIRVVKSKLLLLSLHLI